MLPSIHLNSHSGKATDLRCSIASDALYERKPATIMVVKIIIPDAIHRIFKVVFIFSLMIFSLSSHCPYPIRGTFFGCCASTMTATASITTATPIESTAALFSAHLIWSAIYHGDRAKEKCDLWRHASNKKARASDEIEMNDASV